MDQPEERQQAGPGAAPLVHRIGMMRGIVEQARIERADAIALVVKRPRLAVGARRDEVAILGIEQKHEAEEDGQQPFIKMLGSARRQGLDPRPVGGMETAKQLVQRAQHLRGELGRDLGLRVAAGFEERRQAAVGRVIVQPERGKDQLEAAEHRPAADVAERAKRKLQPAAGLAARRVDEAQFAVGQQKSGRHAGLAQQPLELLVRRRLPAFERAAVRDALTFFLFLLSFSPRSRRALEPTRICQPLSGSVTAQCGARSVSLSSTRTDKSAGSAGPPGAPATCAARQPRICVKNAQGSGSAGPSSSADRSARTASLSARVCSAGLSP